MYKNQGLNDAKSGKRDEFYTQLTDIEKEMVYYKKYFAGSTVYLNCDDYRYSNFWWYFHEHFSEFGLKSLVATCYVNNSHGIKAVYFGGNDLDITQCWHSQLDSDGDFRSEECIELMQDVDIIVTNPPFSSEKRIFFVSVFHD